MFDYVKVCGAKEIECQIWKSSGEWKSAACHFATCDSKIMTNNSHRQDSPRGKSHLPITDITHVINKSLRLLKQADPLVSRLSSRTVSCPISSFPQKWFIFTAKTVAKIWFPRRINCISNLVGCSWYSSIHPVCLIIPCYLPPSRRVVIHEVVARGKLPAR